MTVNDGAQAVCFHIGLSRAASTSLQRRYFRDYTPIGKFTDNSTLTSQILDAFTSEPSTVWSTPAGRGIAAQMAAVASRPTLIYSHESLYNNKIFRVTISQRQGSRAQRTQRLQQLPGHLAEQFAEFRRAAWADRGPVRVLVVIRQQATWLASRYAKSSKHIAGASSHHFDTHIRSMIAGPVATGLHTLNYDEMYEQLCAALGRDNVLFVPFETLGQRDTVGEIATFVDAPSEPLADALHHNTALFGHSVGSDQWQLDPAPLPWQRKLAKVGVPPAFTRRIGRGASVPAPLKIAPELHDLIVQHFDASNRRLAQTAELDLGTHGYFAHPSV